MSSIQIKSNISLADLVQSISQLEADDLDNLIQEITSVRARRKVKNLDKRESELLDKINAWQYTETLWEGFERLDNKRKAEQLSEAEQTQLIEITDQLEQENIARMGFLAELALLRKTDLRSLMDELGITPSNG